MREEIRIFLTALMFYTRIPCPAWVDHSPEYIDKSTRYFPLTGWIVGGAAALTMIGGVLFFSFPVAVLLSMVVSVLITGAFHEDGFADVCDGFGGGWTRKKILEIMKDSRIGAYGVIGMILILLLKLFLTIEILHFAGNEWLLILLIIISSHSISRFIASTFIATHLYVREADSSKIKPVSKAFPAGSILTPGLFGFFPFTGVVYLSGSPLLIMALLIPLLGKVYLGHYFNRWIGGYTGDCLGATQQVTEILFLASVVGLWKYI
ncbi:MAG: adenosylcobinamide-GDP ribazoletransferase [Balneolaceae bacterium]|nr:adenosylcobinamide-GDP ribazoletransferase [Balneolaceae bacterium]